MQRAEELGFFGYHLAEHHNSPLCLAPSPLVLLSALAVQTSRIRLGTLVLLAPTYPLLRLLEEVSMVDELSRGRLALGLGPGVREIELVWLGAEPAAARADVQRAVEAIRRALDDGMVSLPTADGREEDSLFRYSSYRRPHPSLWWAGSLERAAQQGMSVVGAVGPGFTRERVDEYWAAFRSAGDEGPWAETPRVGTTRHVVVADTDEEARTIARRAWAVHADHVFEIPFGLGGETAVRGTAGMGVGEDADEVIARRTQLVAGSPETVARPWPGTPRRSDPATTTSSARSSGATSATPRHPARSSCTRPRSCRP